MCKGPGSIGPRSALRFAFAGMTAALLAGCADSSRFLGDPLANPFKSASVDPAPTASYDRDMPPPAYTPRAAVVSQPLAAPSGMPSRHVASYETPAHTNPRLAETYARPHVERTASVSSSHGHGGWSAEGGMAVIAANGESASVIAERYNVPTDALLRANGFASSGDVRPGTRIIIPVYNAAGGSRIADVEPVRRHDRPARDRLLNRQIARTETKQIVRSETRHVAKADIEPRRERDSDHAKMRWVKGPQPVKLAASEKMKGHGRDGAANLKADKPVEVAETKASRKLARQQAAEIAKQQSKMAKVETVPEKAPKVAKAMVEEKKVDPTPTASLPPANDKVASNGNPEFRWPAHGRIIQGFKSGGNDGINIAVPEGTSVKAAESGVVAYAGSEIKGFGNLVLIRHPNGYVSAYANNSDLAVHRGEQVKRGQTIAKSGQSGNVASPQLHFELRKGSTPVDPTRYLAGL